ADLAVRARERGMQRRLAGVGRADEAHLRRALAAHGERAATRAALLRADELVPELLDARLDVGLEMLRSLVLGNRAQHLLQQVEALARLARGPVGLLRLLVLRGQVGRHGVVG